MHPNLNETRPQDHMAPKPHGGSFYEKPKVTTFGSVAKLTMGGGATQPDGSSTHHKAPHA